MSDQPKKRSHLHTSPGFVLALFGSLSMIALSIFVSTTLVSAQDTPGGDGTSSSTDDPFNACLLQTCEPQRATCAEKAGSDNALALECESDVNACVDACRAGTVYTFPPLTPPAPTCTADVWTCGEWATCAADGSQTRTCTLTTDCAGVTTPEPATSQSCTPPAPPKPTCTADVWDCGAWGSCTASGKQTRTCTLKSDCAGVTTPEPAISQSCTPPKSTPPPPTLDVNTTPSSFERGDKPTQPQLTTPPPSGDTNAPDTTTLQAGADAFAQTQGTGAGDFGLPASDAGNGAKMMVQADQTCMGGGLTPEECKALLTKAFSFEDCAAIGLMTRESCEKYLTDKNNGTFPGCENATPERCQAIEDVLLGRYATSDAKAAADALLAKMIAAHVVTSIDGMMSLKPGQEDHAGWWKSVPTPGSETSAGVIVIDSDGDTLPDDFEVSHGLDPHNAFTHPGIRDDDWLKQHPELLDATATTVVYRKPLQQPRGAGKTDPNMKIGLATGGAGSHVPLTGTCPPNSTCLIYIYSYIPTVLTVTSDASGNFTYDVGDNVGDGAHTAYVAVTDDQGHVETKSSPLAFFVKDAQAATTDQFLGTQSIVNVTRTSQSDQAIYLYGVIALILAAGAITFIVVRRMKAKVRP